MTSIKISIFSITNKYVDIIGSFWGWEITPQIGRSAHIHSGPPTLRQKVGEIFGFSKLAISKFFSYFSVYLTLIWLIKLVLTLFRRPEAKISEKKRQKSSLAFLVADPARPPQSGPIRYDFTSQARSTKGTYGRYIYQTSIKLIA